MIINTNQAALFSRRATSRTTQGLDSAMQKLSSGLRINVAGDDAAGLSISERLTSQINGQNQAKRNANDGISMSQTAEGALSSSAEILQRIRQLAVQSANDTNSTADREALQAEVNQLISEFDRVALDTEFNGQKVLKGDALATSLHVGANRNENFFVIMQSARAADLYSYSLGSEVNTNSTMVSAQSATSDGHTAQRNRLQAQNVTINARNLQTTVVLQSGLSAKSTAQAFNSGLAVDKQGLVAARAETYARLTFTGAGAAALDFSLNGIRMQAASSNVTTDYSDLVTTINQASSQTGVVATVENLAGGGVGILLHASQGEDIQLREMNVALASGGAGTVGVQGMYDAGSTLASAGSLVQLTAGALSSMGRNTTVGGRVLFTNDVAFTFAHNAAGSTGGLFSYPSSVLVSASKGSSINDVDISTANGSNKALAIVDAVLGRINAYRARLGASQTRLEFGRERLGNQAESLSAARSRIRDADFAEETGAMARLQVVQNAGTAMLAQANTLPQRALELLR